MSLTRDAVSTESDFQDSVRYEPRVELPKVVEKLVLLDHQIKQENTQDLKEYIRSLEFQYYWNGVRDVFQIADSLYEDNVLRYDTSTVAVKMLAAVEEKFGPESYKGMSDSTTVFAAFHQGVSEAYSAVSAWSRKVITL